MMNWKKHLSRRKIRVYSLIFLSSLLIAGCGKKEKTPPGKTIAAVDEVRLNERELNKIMQAHSLPLQKRDDAIHFWIENEIYFQEAKNKGLLDTVKYNSLVWEEKRALAKALLFDQFNNSLQINVNDKEVKNYYERNKGEFILTDDAYFIDMAEFGSLDSALSFRKTAILKNWKSAIRKFNAQITENKFTLKRDMFSAEASRAAELLKTNEVSPALKKGKNRYIVFRLKNKFSEGDTLPFNIAFASAKQHLLIEKKVILFNNFKKQIFNNHNIEIYGELNE
jgi:hypothetical protein